ncbi:sodium/hydrogen exchanger 10-like isoform X3 [Zophobas morio]|uniref:sodium/hydrogen exchanger 10-like isoform X3 n=1 Tax=Zophobas morio TaxID=2755281 RepID=UPI003082720A
MKILKHLIVGSIFIIFIGLVIFHEIFSENYKVSPLLEWHALIPSWGDLMMLSGLLAIGYVIQSTLQNFRIATPYGAFIIMVGFIWGMFCFYDQVMMHASNIMNISPRELYFVFVPVMVFQMSFSMDGPLFLKTLSQTFVIGVFVNGLSATLFGILSNAVIAASRDTEVGIIFGITASATFPQRVVNILKQQSTITKQIGILLEGEALFVFIIVDITYKFTLSYVNQHMVWWYQFLLVGIRVLSTGILTGFLFGYVGRYMMRKMCTNRLSVYLICLGMPFMAHSFSEVYTSGCGSISVLIMGAMMGMERTALPKEIDMFLIDFWNVAAFIVDTVLLLKCAMLVATNFGPILPWYQYPLTLVVYVIAYMARFLCFLVFLPILKKLGYGMNLKYIIVCTWGALKGPFGLLTTTGAGEYKVHPEHGRLFLFHITALYFFSVFINGTFITLILSFLGLSKISMARQVNMNNCMKHIFAKRDKTVAVLKMDKFLADVNWPVVIESTEMAHPYYTGMTDEEDEGFLGYRFTWCGDCKKDILQEPSQKEMQEMMKEATMRILKARRMCYSRQYENGMMTKEGIRILSRNAELAMDSAELDMGIENICKNFVEENWFKRFVRKQSQKFIVDRGSKYKKPRTYWRRMCYKIVLKNTLFEKIMFLIAILHLFVIIADMYFNPSLLPLEGDDDDLVGHDYVLMMAQIVFVIIFVIEAVIKILAYSWVYVCYHGFRTYFKSVWNIIDVVVIVVCVLAIGSDVWKIATHVHDRSMLRQVIDVLRLLRAVRLLQIFRIFFEDAIHILDKVHDTDMLPYMIDNTKIRNEMKQKIEENQLVLQQLLGMVQKDRSWIAITVKTTQAIRMVLNGMKESINQLKSTGWVDTFEYEKLVESLNECYKKVNAIQKVQPNSPKTLFKEVTWMADDENLIEFLFENVKVRTFAPDEVVFAEGEIADGIYILVTGLLIMTYKPNPDTIKDLKERGLLPIVDYLSVAQYEQEVVDFIISGNCLGEVSTLTEKPYNCTITANTHSQVYVLTHGVLKRAMAMNPDPVTGLAAKIWKEVGLRITVPLLMSVPAYQTISQDQIKYALERAFVPDLRKYKIFAVTEIIEDIVLIRGVVIDYNTRNMFVAPCYIPRYVSWQVHFSLFRNPLRNRTVQRLILSASSLMNAAFYGSSQTKMLIVPSKDVDEYDVMALAKETCELVSTSSTSQCLQHTVKGRTGDSRRNRQMRRELAQRRGATGSTTSSKAESTASHGHSASSMMFTTSQSETGSVFMQAEEVEKKIDADEVPENKAHANSETLPPPATNRRRQSLFFL